MDSRIHRAKMPSQTTGKALNMYQFPNGLRIIYENPQTDINITSIYCFCKIGSINEDDHTRGASHFIEHMCFQGTKKIKDTVQISETYDKFGAYFNAFTDKEVTCYTIKCPDEHLYPSLSLLSDLMFHSEFDKIKFDKELQVVIQESVNSAEDYDAIKDDVMECMIFRGTPYENPVDSIKYHRGKTSQPFNYKDVVKMYQTFYKPCNFVLSIVSNVPFQKILNMIKKTYFAKIHSISSCTREEPLNIYVSSKQDELNACEGRFQYMCIKKPGNKTTKISIGFQTCSYFHKDMYKLELIKVIVGEMFSSRLFNTLRNKNGLTYNSFVYTRYLGHSGYFSIEALTEYKKLLVNKSGGGRKSLFHFFSKTKKRGFYGGKGTRKKKVIHSHISESKSKRKKKGVFPILIDIINDLVKNGFTQKDLDLAKNFKKARITMHVSNIDNMASFNGENVLLKGFSKDTPSSLKNLYKKEYEPITLKEINDCIQRYFIKSNMKIFMIGEHVLSEAIVKKEVHF